jgi:hypothetical protein
MTWKMPNTSENRLRLLDQLGMEGWEMVVADGSIVRLYDRFSAWFKRPRDPVTGVAPESARSS